MKITDELTLKNPKKEVVSVCYNWLGTPKIAVVINFYENGGDFIHQRSFEFDNPGGNDVTSAGINGKINSHTILKNIPNKI